MFTHVHFGKGITPHMVGWYGYGGKSAIIVGCDVRMSAHVLVDACQCQSARGAILELFFLSIDLCLYPLELQTIEACLLVCITGEHDRENVQLQHLALSSIAFVDMLSSSN
jgi:hypothetical protein